MPPCNTMLKTTIDPEAVKAALRQPELQQLLNREIGYHLCGHYAEIGLPYPYQEVWRR